MGKAQVLGIGTGIRYWRVAGIGETHREVIRQVGPPYGPDPREYYMTLSMKHMHCDPRLNEQDFNA